jgi:hypothetical protein
VHPHPTRTVLGIQTHDQAAFEMWREALEFDAENVELINTEAASWLQLNQETRKFRVPVQLTCHGISDVAPRPAEKSAVAA